MTEQQRITLRRLATDLEPFIGSVARLQDAGDTKLAGIAHVSQMALQALVTELWKESRERK